MQPVTKISLGVLHRAGTNRLCQERSRRCTVAFGLHTVAYGCGTVAPRCMGRCYQIYRNGRFALPNILRFLCSRDCGSGASTWRESFIGQRLTHLLADVDHLVCLLLVDGQRQVPIAYGRIRPRYERDTDRIQLAFFETASPCTPLRATPIAGINELCITIWLIPCYK